MASTITSLTPTIYEALDVVSREMVGYIPAVTQNFSAERAALNQTIMIPLTAAATASDNTPGVTPPDDGEQTVGNTTMTIDKSKYVSISWNGEQQRGLAAAGTFSSILAQQFANAIRTLVNLVEVDLHAKAYKNSSRAAGTAATAPFGTANDLSGLANVRQILDDNGAPQTDLQLVLGSAAVAKIRGVQALLLRQNESGSSELLRRGSITALPLEGFDLHNSAAVLALTAGTGASYVTSGSTAAGVGSIALVTGTGTVLAGDVVTFAADSVNKYVVQTGVAAPGTIVLGAPGAKVVIATANALTIGAAYTPNMAFSRSAMQLITRLPAMPLDTNGNPMDLGDDCVTITDPVTGLTFEVALYRMFHRMSLHVRMAWGTAAIKPNHIATLMG